MACAVAKNTVGRWNGKSRRGIASKSLMFVATQSSFRPRNGNAVGLQVFFFSFQKPKRNYERGEEQKPGEATLELWYRSFGWERKIRQKGRSKLDDDQIPMRKSAASSKRSKTISATMSQITIHSKR